MYTEAGREEIDMPCCWKDHLEYMEEKHGYCSDEYMQVYNEGNGTCLLPLGHIGPHIFIPDRAINIDFLKDHKERQEKE
jgi:hypothetical protein